jgi:hypothetical protein
MEIVRNPEDGSWSIVNGDKVYVYNYTDIKYAKKAIEKGLNPNDFIKKEW